MPIKIIYYFDRSALNRPSFPAHFTTFVGKRQKRAVGSIFANDLKLLFLNTAHGSFNAYNIIFLLKTFKLIHRLKTPT